MIVADRVWQYDVGKRKEQGTGKKRVVKEQQDVQTYDITPAAWKQAAGRVVLDPKAAWLKGRPRSYEAQGLWVLERLLRGEDPLTGTASKTKLADVAPVLARLRKLGLLLKNGKPALTVKGKAHIEEVLRNHRGKLPKEKPFRVHVGPIGSGNSVRADGEAFARLSDTVRKVLGVEMEAAAVGKLAHAKGLPWVVMKAVMDHADGDKSDNFKDFAARASAEVLIAFLREQMEPRAGGEDDPILHPGTSDLPEAFGAAALLNARHQVVPFHGRAELLGDLEAWCRARDKARVRLIHAAGGMGKTRLAIELCKWMRPRGWRAGFLRDGAKVDDLIRSERPVLAVIDYAESRADLKDILATFADRKPGKALRLLLLARNADAWWTDLRRADGFVKDLLCEEPIELRPVTPEREVIFREALTAFEKAQDKKAAGHAVPPLTHPKFERVLYVHAAALATVEGREVKVDSLMEETVDHEERFWRQQIEDDDVEDMRRVVTALTLKGGAASAIDVLTLVESLVGERDKKTARLLHKLYPGKDGKYVAGLEPDLLGEAMVWRALHEEGAGAEPYLDRVFDGASKEEIRTGFTVLGRLSEDRPEASAWIARVLGQHVVERAMEALEAAKIVGERTAHSPLGMELAKALEREGTSELAARMEKGLPHPQQTVSLREVGRWVLATRLKALPEGPETEEERAWLLNNLSVWQGVLGQHEAALASTQEAVAIRRRLAQARPEAFEPYLATSLNNLGMMQSALGQREAALASTQEAVAIRRKLAQARPEAFEPVLAASLNNLGIWQNALGQHEAALASTQEAVSRYHKLAQARPEAFEPDLAMSLNNLGGWQNALGQHEAALASMREAVDLYRKLTQARPEAFEPDLAMGLNNLGMMQSALGQREAALASTQEALSVYRKLAQARPEAFEPGLARSLNNLGIWQNALGQREAALASTQEAVAIRRKLAQARPEAFAPDLAVSLYNLSVDQRDHGQHEAALTSAQEALDTIWPLFLRLPAAFAEDTGDYLAVLHDRLAALGLPPTPELLAREADFAARRPA